MINKNFFFRKLTFLILLFWGFSHIAAADEYPLEFHKPQDDLFYLRSNNEQLVLQYFKAIQDNFSGETLRIPEMQDNSGQIFNNAVTAKAFILSGEKERAVSYSVKNHSRLRKLFMIFSLIRTGHYLMDLF